MPTIVRGPNRMNDGAPWQQEARERRTQRWFSIVAEEQEKNASIVMLADSIQREWPTHVYRRCPI